MAVDKKVLDDLVSSGFGPAQVTQAGAGYHVSVGDKTATVEIEGPTVRVRSESPGGKPQSTLEGADNTVELALADLERQTGGITEVDATATAVVTTTWLESSQATAGDVIAAAMAMQSLARTGAIVLSELAIQFARQEAIDSQEDIPIPPPPEASSAPPSQPPVETVWVYVSQSTPGMDPADATRQITTLEPGNWYQLIGESGGWATVAASDGSWQVLVNATQVKRQS